MLEKLIIGWAINSIWLIHLLFKNKSSLPLKLVAIVILAMPYLGFIFYFILYVMVVPPPQPKHLRQNRRNHYGTTNFGEDDDYLSDDGPRLSEKLRRSGKSSLWVRITIFILGLVTMSLGISSIYSGMWSYTNWWGGTVFGPVAILFGCFLCVGATLKWNKI